MSRAKNGPNLAGFGRNPYFCMKNRLEMKRILMIGGLLAAFLCLSQSARAQYVQIHRDGSDFVDDRGVVLSDQTLIDLVGDDVFFETVVGARRQYNTGRRLIRGGAIGMGAGLLTALGGAALFVANSGEWRDYDTQTWHYYDTDNPGAVTGAILLAGGYVAIIAGSLALEAGIPFKVIGQSRLNWVENDYNDRALGYSLHVGAAPNGVGLTLRF